jgi:endoglucanase Acf2
MSKVSLAVNGTSYFDDPPTEIFPPQSLPFTELLTFALPHHQERMRNTVESTNVVKTAGCMPTIHGMACPVSHTFSLLIYFLLTSSLKAVGNTWSLVEHLHRTAFHFTQSPKIEMLDEIMDAAKKDLQWRLPSNYMIGAGDTYFSGKLLARFARVLIIADELGLRDSDEFNAALDHLKDGEYVFNVFVLR